MPSLAHGPPTHPPCLPSSSTHPPRAEDVAVRKVLRGQVADGVAGQHDLGAAGRALGQLVVDDVPLCACWGRVSARRCERQEGLQSGTRAATGSACDSRLPSLRTGRVHPCPGKPLPDSNGQQPPDVSQPNNQQPAAYPRPRWTGRRRGRPAAPPRSPSRSSAPARCSAAGSWGSVVGGGGWQAASRLLGEQQPLLMQPSPCRAAPLARCRPNARPLLTLNPPPKTAPAGKALGTPVTAAHCQRTSYFLGCISKPA